MCSLTNIWLFFNFRGQFPFTSLVLQPPHLIRQQDGPFVWILQNPEELDWHEKQDDSSPVKVDVQMFMTTWFNMSEDRIWNLNRREQLPITSTEISTPKTPEMEFSPSAPLSDAGLLIDVWVLILSLLIQDHLCRRKRLEHGLRILWRKLNCPGGRPTLCVAGRKRRRRRKKAKKTNRDPSQITLSAGEINRAKEKKKKITVAATKKKETDNMQRVSREAEPETYATTIVRNLPKKLGKVKRKKKVADKSHEPKTPIHAGGRMTGPEGDNTWPGGDWTTVRRRRRRKADRRNSTGDVDMTTMTKSVSDRRSKRHSSHTDQPKPRCHQTGVR
ncbi:uncharacterized protein LOC135462121 [Liolophura sinensis]|uniref:uncharacterized protein LOC135462121 n=1 Tax=Liolophura sinensis TaxID=3198878 RepID=UPI0031594DF1